MLTVSHLICLPIKTIKKNSKKNSRMHSKNKTSILNISRKFGVKLQNVSSIICKKVLDDETLSKSGDDLDIIDYPNEPSIIPYIKKEEVETPNIYLVKKIESLKLQKIEKLEQTNLTLSEDDIDNEIEEKETSHNIDINIVNEQNEPDLVLSSKKNKDDSGNEKKKEIYKKKVIVPSTNANNKENTFDSFSFLSNVTSSKLSNKRPPKVKNNEKMQERLVKSSKKKNVQKITKEETNDEEQNILTSNNTGTNINMNDIKLYENFQKLKQIEQLMQLKEFEKMKSLLELQKNANLLYSNNKFSNEPRNSNIIPQQNLQNIPNIQNMNPTYPLPQINQKVDLNEPEPRACKYCEEIYKHLIINNLPIKMITCLYCHREMNSKTLEYYINECKRELKEKYKKEVGVSNKSNNLLKKGEKFGDISTEKISSDEDEENEKEEEEDEQEEEEEKKEKRSQQNNKNKQKLINISSDKEEEEDKENQNISKTPKKQEQCLNENKMTNNIQIIQPSSLQNSNAKIEAKSQNESMFFTGNSLNNTTTNNNISLAEAFRSRHSRIINNIEKRAHSIKEKSISTEPTSNNLEMQNIYKKLNRTNNSQTKDEIKQISLSRHVNTSRSVTEPSPELMNRLIKGERAKMSQKEMRELNNRIYNRLPDVIGQKEDDGKKEELTKLNLIKKNYTDKLKEKVVKKFKGKQLKKPNKKTSK